MNSAPRPSTSITTNAYLTEFQQVILEKSQNFVGRKFIFTAVTDFLNRHKCGYLTILGTPGSGKSAILGKYVTENPDAVYYNAQNPWKNCAEEFLKDTCRQLMRVLETGDLVKTQCYNTSTAKNITLPDNVTEGSWFLSLILQKISDALESNQRLIVVVDGLDAVDYESQPLGSNLFYLPRYLPERVYFLLARRPFIKAKARLLIETPSQILDLAAYPEQNQKDVQAYIRRSLITSVATTRETQAMHCLSNPCLETESRAESGKRSNLKSWLTNHNISEEEFCDDLFRKSENNFMYLSQILSAIAEGFYLKPYQRHRLPLGLEAYYQQHWRKMKEQGLSHVALSVLSVLNHQENGRGISPEVIAEIIDEDEYEVQEVLENWLEFLVQRKVSTETRYSLYHYSFQDWLAKQWVNGGIDGYVTS